MALIDWVIPLVLLGNAAWVAWRVFRTDTRGRGLLLDAAGNLVFTLVLANLATVQWNSTVPLPVWWVTASLLAAYAGGVAYRLTTRVGVSPNDPARRTGITPVN